MILAVDGFNLIYKFPELEEHMYSNRLDKAKNGLLNILNQYKNKKGNTTIRVYFDGKKDLGSTVVEEDFNGIKVHYSHDFTADYYLKLYIKQEYASASVLVITSDNDILLFAKRHKCKSQKSEDFAKWVTEFLNSEKDKRIDEKDADVKLSKNELDFWTKLFKKRGC